jgi:ferritin-like metal-binding protein YciE
MKLSTLQSLYIEELRDLYAAATQIMRSLPKIAKGADSPRLREALTDQLHQAQAHIDRMEKMFDRLGIGPKGSAGRAIEAIITLGKDVEGSDAQPTVQDAAIIASSQRAGYYLMAGCVVTRDLAKHLGHVNAVGLLQAMLEENQAVAERLSALSDEIIKVKAESGAVR